MLSHTLAPCASRLTFHVFRWRRGWDSNPRSHCWDACFPSMSIRPLSHLSTPISRGGILTRGLMTSKLTANARCHGFDLPISKRTRRKYGSEDSHQAEYPGRPLGLNSFAALCGEIDLPHTHSATEVEGLCLHMTVYYPYSSKMFDEILLSLSTASALLISGNQCSACDARVAFISMFRRDYACHLTISALYSYGSLGKKDYSVPPILTYRDSWAFTHLIKRVR